MNDVGSTLVAHCGARRVTRQELKDIPVPEGTKTHQPLSHYEIVEVLEEALSFRYLKVQRDEYAISPDGMKMFGVMDLNFGFNGGSFSIGLRNSNDKSMRLALTAGYRVFVCDNMAFSGDFTPLFHKHTRNLELRDSISIAVDRIHRGFKSLEVSVKEMQARLLTDNDVRLLIYEAFMDRRIRGIPRNLMPLVHDHYFDPSHEAFQPRNLWSLSNAFTSAFKKLAPIKQFEVTARLGSFLQAAQGTKQRQGCMPQVDNEENVIPFVVQPLTQQPAGGNGFSPSPIPGGQSGPSSETGSDQNTSTGIHLEKTEYFERDVSADDDLTEYPSDDFSPPEDEVEDERLGDLADEMMEEYKRKVTAA